MVTVTKEQQKEEAIIRMKMLEILPDAIETFEKENRINVSEPPSGIFCKAKDEDLERIREFEEAHGAMVFLIVRSFTSLGGRDCFLYVSKYNEEWEDDRRDFGNGKTSAYVYNRSTPEYSEIGYIGIMRTNAEGLIRKW